MKMKTMFIVALALMIPIVVAYSVQMNIDADVTFNTDVYACDDSSCDDSNLETSGNSYSLSGGGSDYYLEFDYAECFKPHIYEVHVWGDETGTNNYFIDLVKIDDCVGNVVDSDLSDDDVEIGDSVEIGALVHSAYDLPDGVPSATVIPGALEDEYSSLIGVKFYANGVKIGEDELSILMGEDADFEVDWTPSVAGTYDITIVSSVIDCACSEPNPQTTFIGTVVVNDIPCVENIVSIQSEWVNDSECIDGNMRQRRTRTEYDANNCGTFDDVVKTDYQYFHCEMLCIENVIFGDWDAWVNDTECVDNWMNQSRIRTEYDANSCGDFDDVLHIEERSIVCGIPCSPDVLFGDWSDWVNQSECSANLTLVQVRTRTEYDNNSCGIFDSVVHTDTMTVNCTLPVCTADENCSADYYDDRYCIGDDVYKDFHNFTCEEEGCVENVTEEFVKECDEDCKDGKCEDDDDDRNDSWNDRSVVWNDLYQPNNSNVIILSTEEIEEKYNWWLWIVLILIVLILIISVVISKILTT